MTVIDVLTFFKMMYEKIFFVIFVAGMSSKFPHSLTCGSEFYGRNDGKVDKGNSEK